MPTRRNVAIFDSSKKFAELIYAVNRWSFKPISMETIQVGGRDKMVFTGANGQSIVVVPVDYMDSEEEARAFVKNVIGI